MSTEHADTQDSTAAEIERTDDVWKGPFPETDRYGEPTGAQFVRCRDCGIEVPADAESKQHASHRDGCRYA